MFWAVVVLIASAVLLISLRELHLFLHPERNSWVLFWADWGAAIGVLYGVVLTAIVVVLPSKVEGFMTTLAERMQSPLTDFSQVMERATWLLAELGNRQGTVFKVISASPILGLELKDTSGDRWRRLLVHRIEANCDTHIVCLDPETQFAPTAPLTAFCRVLAEHHLKQPDRFEELLKRGRNQIQKFQDDYLRPPNARTNLTMKFGDEPGYQIIIARDEKGTSKAILFFSSKHTLMRGIKPSGFSTEDGTMVKVLEMLFDQCSDAAKEALEDPRTPKQRERDARLQVLHESKPGNREISADDIAPGFKLLVTSEVFPPDIELAGQGFAKAIEQSVERLWKHVPLEDRLGIDVGTGTGVLALVLAKYCANVIATDVFDTAIQNADQNFKRFKDLTHSSANFQTKLSDLLEQVDIPPKGQTPLIVFNHPYYPSPANVYHIGGAKAGFKLIEPFLERAQAFVEHGGGIIMAYSEVAGEAHSPLYVALRLKYKPEILVEDRDPEFGFQKIFLFTR